MASRGKLILITGGVRSGKSRFAEELAKQLGKKVTYIATCIPLDDELRRRVAAHKERRHAGWETVEEPQEVDKVIREVGKRTEVILVDCLTMLVCNLLPPERDEAFFVTQEEEKLILARLDNLATEAKKAAAHVIIVSNEVGLGIVPDYPMGRIYRDFVGWANQAIASRADEVYLMVAGLPLEIKSCGERTRARVLGQDNA